MEQEDKNNFKLISSLGLLPFEEAFPWYGGDLQTLRDTFISEDLTLENSERIEINVPSLDKGVCGSGKLLAFLDRPSKRIPIIGLVILVHGLGGSSRRQGVRRMAIKLRSLGFAVLRLNLRGADPCRKLISGTYSAACNSDLIPVFEKGSQLCQDLSPKWEKFQTRIPLYGAGISLGGTILLNACLHLSSTLKKLNLRLDGLVCTSSPLDLAVCSQSIERLRNFIYQNWLLKRLARQTNEDPFTPKQKLKLRRIRDFDELITAPRWGYKDVNEYYLEASPIKTLLKRSEELPPTLLLQALDDPWVPAESLISIDEKVRFLAARNINIVLTNHGGHNGFHGKTGCWGDDLVSRWLKKLALENSI